MPIERHLAYKLDTEKVQRFFVTGGWEPNAPEVFFGSDESSAQTAWKDAVSDLKSGNFYWSMDVFPQKQPFEIEAPKLISGTLPVIREEAVQLANVIFLGSYRGECEDLLVGNFKQIIEDKIGAKVFGIHLGNGIISTPLEAFQQIETRLGSEIPPEVCYAFMMSWYAIASPENKIFYNSSYYRSVISQAVNVGCSAIGCLFTHQPSNKPCEAPWGSKKIKEAAHRLISLAVQHIVDPHSDRLREMVLADTLLGGIYRPTDIARVIMEAGKLFVRNDIWLTTPEAKFVAEYGSYTTLFPWIALAAAESIVGSPPKLNLGYGEIPFGGIGILPSSPLNKIYDSDALKYEVEREYIRGLMKDEIISEITRARFLLQAIELKVGGIPVEAAKALLGTEIRVGSILDVGVDLRFSEETKFIMKAIAESFCKEAEKDPQYAPYGCFRVAIPPSLKQVLFESKSFQVGEGEVGWMSHVQRAQQLHTPDSNFLTEGYEIFAYPDCLWVRSFNGDGDKGFVYQWRPDRPLRNLLFTENYKIFTNAILAGIWHDLRVSGGESFVSKHTDKRKILIKRTDGHHNHRHNKKKTQRLIPRVHERLLELEGDLEWGSESDRATIKNQVHGVIGHVRLLPQGWNSSQSAKLNAAQYGIILPVNSQLTFVRPHIRGRVSGENGLKPQTIINAKALATLSALEF